MTPSPDEPLRTRDLGHDAPVGFAQLSVICLVAISGPLLALPRRLRLPVVLGELLAGVVLGRTGVGYLQPGDATFTFLADIGFALVMFVAGSHVPVRNAALRPAIRAGALRALLVGVVAAVLGEGLALVSGVPHAAVYAVLIASSSAALVLPVVDSLGLGGPAVLGLLPQVAIADAACILALPLVIDPAHAVRAAVGALCVVAAAVAVFLVLRTLERRGWRHRTHAVSEERNLALELRIQLTLLFALSALAVWRHVSVLLAGFAFGLAVAAVGEPRRLAKQLFALTEGFLGPVFFVWLGATLDLRALGTHPRMLLLGLGLGSAAVLAHLAPTLTRQPAALSLLAAAQLGVPVAAATVGTQLGVLEPGEASAMMLGALVTVGVAVAGGSRAASPRTAQESG